MGGWETKELTGIGTIEIRFYQKPNNDNSTPKKPTGTTKGTEATNKPDTDAFAGVHTGK
jgi:hypothetical protein